MTPHLAHPGRCDLARRCADEEMGAGSRLCGERKEGIGGEGGGRRGDILGTPVEIPTSAYVSVCVRRAGKGLVYMLCLYLPFTFV